MEFVFTICSLNFVRRATVLLNSASENAKGLRTCLFVVDRTTPETWKKVEQAVSAHEIIPIERLKLDNFEKLAFKYTLVELNTAVKGAAIEFLYARGAKKVVYLDPDILVMGNLSPVFQLLDKHRVVVTPHAIVPFPERPPFQHEVDSRLYGIMNLGFIALDNSDTSKDLVRWWRQRLANGAYVDRHLSMAYDQRWADYFVALFGQDILVSRDPGLNVATWNLHEREVIQKDGCFKVRSLNREHLLVFFHFSGYRIGSDRLNWRWPETAFPRESDVMILASLYDQRIAEITEPNLDQSPYGFQEFSNGVPIHFLHRRLFRQLNDSYPGDPFNADGDFFKSLRAHGLIQRSHSHPAPSAHEKGRNAHRLESIFVLALRIFFRYLGLHRYMLLQEALYKYSRPENHAFLLSNRRKSR